MPCFLSLPNCYIHQESIGFPKGQTNQSMDQNEIQKLILSCGCLISPKGAKQFNIERKVYSTNGTGMNRYPYRKRNVYILTLYLYAVLCCAQLLSQARLFATPWTVACQAPRPWSSPGKNTGVGSLSFLQGIFPTQESNQGLLHCRQILYQLSYQGRPLYQYTQS